MLCSPDTPRLLEATALIEVGLPCKADTGRLMAPVGRRACGKEAASVALLARVDHAAAGKLELEVLVLQLVLAVDATGARGRRAQLGLVKGSALIPLNDIVEGHFTRVYRTKSVKSGVGTSHSGAVAFNFFTK